MTLLNANDPVHAHLTAAEYEVARTVGERRATEASCGSGDPHFPHARRDYIDTAVAECDVAKYLGSYWSGLGGGVCSAHPWIRRVDVAPNVRVRHLRHGVDELALRPAEFEPRQILIGAHVLPENSTTVVLLGCFDLDLVCRNAVADIVTLRYLMPMAALVHHEWAFGVTDADDIDDH